MIGAETERTAKHHRNEDIDSERTPLNYYFKKTDGGLAQAWNNMMQNFGATYKETKKSFAFEGLVITSGHEFFTERGYIPGEPLPRELQKFFEDCYAFALRQIGYHGTDKNILSAVIHLDETTPHLQLYYIPIVDEGRKKVYAKDERGKTLRNAKGSPVQAKDSNGKSIFTSAKLKRPKVCSSEFWEQRGAQISYGNLQNEFHEQVAWRYGLERGEVGSNKKHTTKYQWQKQQQEKELAEKDAALTQATAKIEEADKTLQDKNADISAAEKKLEQIQFRADIAEGRQAHAERATQKLESERERLTREVAPLTAAAEAFRQASGKKPDKKQIPALLAENARTRKRIGVQPQRPTRTLYRTAEIGKGESNSEKGSGNHADAYSPRTRQIARSNGYSKAPPGKQAYVLSRQFVVMDKVTFLQLNISKKTIAFIREIW